MKRGGVRYTSKMSPLPKSGENLVVPVTGLWRGRGTGTLRHLESEEDSRGGRDGVKKV